MHALIFCADFGCEIENKTVKHLFTMCRKGIKNVLFVICYS